MAPAKKRVAGEPAADEPHDETVSSASLYQSLCKTERLMNKLTFGRGAFADYWSGIGERAGLPANYLYLNFLTILSLLLAPGASRP